MAGGRGERFWPKSRVSRPKQFLSLTRDGETMLQKTAKRLLPLVDMENIFVVTNESYAALTKEQLPALPDENILAEPAPRNTAPCIGLAAAAIRKRYGEAMMLVLPSDHLIRYEEMYIDTMRAAIEAAKKDDNLVTVGITPTYPETGYGYINFARDTALGLPGVYRVERFVEKPDAKTARAYLESHRYLWNSGMFVWKVTSILQNLETLMPDIYEGLCRIEAAVDTPAYEDVLEREYDAFRAESIDFGVMERAGHIYTLPGSFGWDDVGNWLAIERINPVNEYGNYIEGDVITIHTEHTTICGSRRLIAAVGVENLIVVDTDDALLICSKNDTQDVKKVIENLKICNRQNLI